MKKVILVSGGNRGIGLGICKALDKLGHIALIGSRNVEKSKDCFEVQTQGTKLIELDVTEPKSMDKAAEKIEKEFGKLDVLVNNAGIGIGNKGAVDADLSEVRKIMDTNFFGAWQLARQMLPLLEKSDDGRIINMSSGMGALDDLHGGYAGYRLSKTALNGLTILLANELAAKGILVNAMCPGWVRTDMGGQGAPRSVVQGADTAVWLATASNIGTGSFYRDRMAISW